MVPNASKLDYNKRLCMLCDENDIEDEYHILMKCNHFKGLGEKVLLKFPVLFLYKKKHCSCTFHALRF